MAIPIAKPLNVQTNIDGPSTKMRIDTSTSHIFELLSEKLYSNPIGSVCREITCNARDAHRAAKIDTPIRIVLPGDAYIVKDFGTGMSPETIDEVYSVYGKSSKRETNEQTGMFGIGAKSPFSITSQYTVITNWQGIEYTYLCFKDTDRIGKIKLVKKEESHEAGTTVKIPVKYDDRHKFRQETLYYTKFWTVKPDIAGEYIDDSTYPKFTLQGTKWAYAPNLESTIVYDGIPYPLKWTSGVCFYADIGEIEVTPNREELLFNEITNKTIEAQKAVFHAEYKVIFEQTLTKAKTYKDAWKLVQDEQILRGQGPYLWNGKEVFRGSSGIRCLNVETTREGRKRIYDSNVHLLNTTTPVFYFDFEIETDKYGYKSVKLKPSQHAKLSKYFKLHNVQSAIVTHSDYKYIFDDANGGNTGTDINKQKVKEYKPQKRAGKLQCRVITSWTNSKKRVDPKADEPEKFYYTKRINVVYNDVVYIFDDEEVKKLENDGVNKWVNYERHILAKLQHIPEADLKELAAQAQGEWYEFSDNLSFIKEINHHYKLVQKYNKEQDIIRRAVENGWIKYDKCTLFEKYPIFNLVNFYHVRDNIEDFKRIFNELYGERSKKLKRR